MSLHKKTLEGNLPEEKLAANPTRHVKIALWTYCLLVALVTLESWTLYRQTGVFFFRPLFTRSDRYTDLLNYVDKTAHLYRGAAVLGRGLPMYTYPAPAAFVYKALICGVPGHAAATYLTVFGMCVLGFALVALKASRSRPTMRLSVVGALFVTGALGYPVWFVADRGNIEAVVWAFAACGLCFFLRARYRTAASCIGLAASIKPFPALFLLLLLRRRRYKEVALGVAIICIVTLASLVYLGPNPIRAYQQLKPGVSLYMEYYILNVMPYGELRFVHSLLDGMKSVALALEMHGLHPIAAVAEITRLRAHSEGWHTAVVLAYAYPPIAAVAFGWLLVTFYRMPALNQMTSLAVAITLFPLSAGDYTLLQLYVPFGAFVVFLAREVATGNAAMRYSSMLAFTVIYALLFSPLTLLMLYAGDAKLLLLLALLFVTARTPMHSALFDDPGGLRIAEESEPVSGEVTGLLA